MQLLYNVVLVSAVQRSESAICICISPPSGTSLPLSQPTHVCHHRAPSWAPCAFPRFPLASSFTPGSVYMSVLISLFIPPASPCDVHMSLLDTCISIPALQIGSSVPFSRFHIYTLIYFICFSLWLTSLCVTDFRPVRVSTNDPVWFFFYGRVTFHCIYATIFFIHSSVPVFIAALFTVARMLRQPKCISSIFKPMASCDLGYAPWTL